MANGEAAAREGSIEAVARLYHDALTALILTVVVQRGREVAAVLVFRLFRRKHLGQFLPGLEKLGLRGLPPAVAARTRTLERLLGASGDQPLEGAVAPVEALQ